MSAHMASDSRIWWWRELTLVEASMSRRKKILPAGITLAAKESFPTSDWRVCLEHVADARVMAISWSMVVSFSVGIREWCWCRLWPLLRKRCRYRPLRPPLREQCRLLPVLPLLRERSALCGPRSASSAGCSLFFRCSASGAGVSVLPPLREQCRLLSLLLPLHERCL